MTIEIVFTVVLGVFLAIVFAVVLLGVWSTIRKKSDD